MNKNLFFDMRFWPIFWTQFFGAFNDNVFKNALVILITFKSYQLMGLQTEQMVALCGGIFILPFFLFSAIAGQICDKYPKDKLIVLIKCWELLVMVLGAVGFVIENVPLLLLTLFVMGLQSTFFGPIKYAVLPELIENEEMVEGNALVGMGTFLAILFGTITGGVLIAFDIYGRLFTSIAVLLFAVIGLWFGKKVQRLKPTNPNLKIQFGIFGPTWRVVEIIKKNRPVKLSIFGISWFWFLGAALLSMFPVYAKTMFNGNEHVVTFFLAVFSIGVAVGSMICEKLSRHHLELGLVPMGTLGMSFFIIDLYFIKSSAVAGMPPIGILEFLSSFNSLRVMVDLFGLSIFAGFYIVPLYTLIQTDSASGERSRVIAANNILNSLMIVLSAVFLMLLYSFNFSFGEIFLILGILNFVVSFYIYTVIPEFMLRFVSYILTHIMYSFKVKGQKNIPAKSGAIIVCNHLSFVDWLVVAAGIKRPPRFVMYYKFMKIPIIHYLFRDAKIIPIAGKKEDPVILEKAMRDIKLALEKGDLICIFPEGEITHDGKLAPYRPGIERILKEVQVPVIPVVLRGLWGSIFSRKKVRFFNPFKRWVSKIELEIYPAWKAEDVTAKKLEEFTLKHL